MKRIFAIGDIHGCLDQLIELINKLPITDKDELVFLGDYIDRGPDSKGVINYLLNMNVKYKTVFLRGNHEDMMLRSIQNTPINGDVDLWFANGGFSTMLSYGMKKNKIPQNHIDFIENTVLYYETKEFIFVHAGFNPTIKIEQHPVDYFTWVREEFINDKSEWPKKVIFGHTPYNNPLIMKNKIGIDTGCVFGKKLTCVELPIVKFYQVSNNI